MSPAVIEPSSATALDRLMMGSSLRRPRVARWVVAGLAIALALSLIVLFLVVTSLSSEGMRIFGRALVFAALLSAVPIGIVGYLDRRERESPWLVAVAVLWGALIATGLALPLNTGIMVAVAGWLERHSELQEYLGPKGALLVGAPLAAPLVEETIKGLGVVLLMWLTRAEFDGMRDGFVYGALVGVGFNMFEAPLYIAQGFEEHGVAPWGLQLGARFALFGLGGHALFTGLFGASLGLARQTTRSWVRLVAPMVGLALAFLAHTLNNSLGLIITVLMRSAGEELPEPGPPPEIPMIQAWLYTSIQNLIIFLPFVIVMLLVLRRSGKWERRVIEEELADEVGHTVLPEEYEAIRRDAIFRTRRIDRMDKRRSAALVNAQHELALRKHRVRLAGEDPETDALVEAWRGDIALLRATRS